MPFFISAQTYGNEWIDYSETHYKIKVAEDGLYKLTRDVLEASGYPIPIIGNEIAIYHNGNLVPIYMSQNGIWNSTDYLYFYGEKNDGSLDKELYENPDWHHNPEMSLFTDTAVYFLRKDTDSPSPQYILTENDLSQNLPPAEEYYIAKESRIIGGKNSSPTVQFSNGQIAGRVQIYSSTHHPDTFDIIHSGVVNYYSPSFLEGEGIIGFKIQNPPQSPNDNIENIPLDFSNFKAATGESIIIDFTVAGLSNEYTDTIPEDHHFMADFKGQNYIDTYFDGYESVDYNITISDPALIMDASEILKISALGDIIDRVGLFDINYSYPREFYLDNEAELNFQMHVDQVEGNYIEFQNEDAVADYILIDRTAERLFFLDSQMDGSQEFFIPPSSYPSLDLILLERQASSVYHIVENLEEVSFTDYSISQGNYVFISPPVFLEGPSYVDFYSQFRSSALGGSYSTIVVDVEQLYDQFSYGIKQHPLSIKRFMSMAKETWSLKPEYLLLLGKGYVYHKARFNPSLYEENLIPVWGSTSSDRFFTSDDFLPTGSIPTGRLNVTSQYELEEYIYKLITYSNYQPEDDWRNNILHVEGGNGSYQTEFFYSELDEMAAEVTDGSFEAKVSRCFLPNLAVRQTRWSCPS